MCNAKVIKCLMISQGNYDVLTLAGLGPIGRELTFFITEIICQSISELDLPSSFPDVNWSSIAVSTGAVLFLLRYLPLLPALSFVRSFLALSDFMYEV